MAVAVAALFIFVVAAVAAAVQHLNLKDPALYNLAHVH